MATEDGIEREATTTDTERTTPTSLTAAVRRERLAELAAAIGETAIVEGDKLIVETGEPVALYARIEPDGAITLTWWMTGSTSTAHPRWAEAAGTISRPDEGEAIHTSALGGGFLVEVERRAKSIQDATALARDRTLAERVLALIAAYPDAVAKLPAEPVPDYLLPDRDVS